MTVYIENYVPVVEYNGLNTAKAVDLSGAPTTALAANTTIGGSSVVALSTITSVSANALTVGRQGTTNPAFNVDASAGTQLTGLNLVAKGTGAGYTVAVVESGGTNNALAIDAMGNGVMTLNGTATGNVKVGHGLTGATQALSGAGAVDLVSVTTKITNTGTNALTLADGADGQIKILTYVAGSGSSTLTPTTKTGYSTIVMSGTGQGCIIVFTTTTGWMAVANNGATIS